MDERGWSVMILSEPTLRTLNSVDWTIRFLQLYSVDEISIIKGLRALDLSLELAIGVSRLAIESIENMADGVGR